VCDAPQESILIGNGSQSLSFRNFSNAPHLPPKHRAQEYLIHNQNCIADRPTVQGCRERFELALAFLARDGFVAHRGLPGHDGHEDSSLPEVLSPYGIS